MVGLKGLRKGTCLSHALAARRNTRRYQIAPSAIYPWSCPSIRLPIPSSESDLFVAPVPISPIRPFSSLRLCIPGPIHTHTWCGPLLSLRSVSSVLNRRRPDLPEGLLGCIALEYTLRRCFRRR